jgi:hypothetical protein
MAQAGCGSINCDTAEVEEHLTFAEKLVDFPNKEQSLG